MTIQPGQTYRSVKPSDKGWRIRIVDVGPFSARAIEAANGRPLLNRIMLHSLHSSPTTKNGAPRRTGYILEGA
ncbi:MULTISPECIES: hypothetical protein [Streptomyces]|uniref:hypothetical protein n=1 Tax=Streptomyces TaxID=1883 RepID=UPI000E0363C8|nr:MULTISPECIES: hypothetical protein [Streptomyces]MBT3077631.1 hypothetical protein [Streptomyces sp. COG21]MBT3084477.1 hypothetical protein [Streptomyces sp. COG20]MBT3085384.1 hypothetical protein [Streptomyces sp. CYG21]MBT3098976.1 hypothetical protein [Streptomyces sp. CBG30]MBT3103574.1 hypothetical protein [Streptomyces sp. COG19]